MPENETQELQVEGDDVKIGAEISRRNAAKIQAAHDALSELGATCTVQIRKDIEIPSDEDAVIQYGETVKAVRTDDGVKVGGYLIRFTNQTDLDLTGDYFAADTDYDTDLPTTRTAVVEQFCS
jgi:hypothetical protein